MEKKDLAFLSLAHFTNDGLVLLLPTLLPLIAKELSLSYIEIGIIGGSILISHGVGQFIAGYYSDQIKRRSDLVTLGLILSSISIFFIGLSDSYFQLQILAIFVGLSTSIYHPVGFSILSILFNTESKGKATGIHGASGSIGLVTFPIIAGILAEEFGWRFALKLIPIIGLIAGGTFLIFTKNLSADKINFKTKINMRFFSTDILAIIFVYSTTTMVSAGFMTFLPVKLTLLNFSPLMVGIYISVFYGMGIIGQYIGGIIVDKFDIKRIISLSLLITAFLLYFFGSLPSSAYIILFLIAVGFFCAVLYPANFVQYTNNTPPDIRGTSLGIFFGIGGVIGAFTPIIMGYVTETTDLSTAFLFLPLICIAGVLVISKTK